MSELAPLTVLRSEVRYFNLFLPSSVILEILLSGNIALNTFTESVLALPLYLLTTCFSTHLISVFSLRPS